MKKWVLTKGSVIFTDLGYIEFKGYNGTHFDATDVNVSCDGLKEREDTRYTKSDIERIIHDYTGMNYKVVWEND